jgi:hypothetical protein
MSMHLKQTAWAKKASDLEQISFAAAWALKGEYAF